MGNKLTSAARRNKCILMRLYHSFVQAPRRAVSGAVSSALRHVCLTSRLSAGQRRSAGVSRIRSQSRSAQDNSRHVENSKPISGEITIRIHAARVELRVVVRRQKSFVQVLCRTVYVRMAISEPEHLHLNTSVLCLKFPPVRAPSRCASRSLLP